MYCALLYGDMCIGCIVYEISLEAGLRDHVFMPGNWLKRGTTLYFHRHSIKQQSMYNHFSIIKARKFLLRKKLPDYGTVADFEQAENWHVLKTTERHADTMVRWKSR